MSESACEIVREDRPLLCLFAKVRNEIVREGNLYRMLANAERIGVDAAVILDDGSIDGTAEAVEAWIARRPGEPAIVRFEAGPAEARATAAGPPWPSDQRWWALLVAPEHPERAFERELRWKQRMLDAVHVIQPHFVLWMDADEVFDRAGTDGLRAFCEAHRADTTPAWAFHYTQLWRVSTWARTDEGFDDGWFIKLWRWAPDLDFEVREDGPYKGLHHPQFPRQIMTAFERRQILRAPWEQVHYGNYGANLRWKCIQYAGGRGGVDRHLRFDRAQYRPVDPCLLPAGAESWPVLPADHHAGPTREAPLHVPLFLPSRPAPYAPGDVERILALGNLCAEPEMFTVVIPAYNRADTLDKALQSLLDQTYSRWVAVVLDDGSQDDTPALMRSWQDRDPRIFYARYPENRGGVAMNEIGMALACEWTEWWTRLGSDDWFGPTKLALDALALRHHDACYGPYQVLRDGRLMEICNGPATTADLREALVAKRFACSWANCAARTAVLRALRTTYGHFCDPRLRNMEDFLVNARIARVSRGWVWRGRVAGQLVINPTREECAAIIRQLTARPALDDLEAVWSCVTTGASGNTLQTTRDENLTRRLITEDTLREQGLLR